MGTAVSVGGTNTGTTNGNSTGSSSGSGSNGGYSLGTPVNSSSSIQTMVNSMLMGLGAVTGTTAVAQNFAAGLQRVATAIGSTVARVAETAARTIAVHAGASAAGYQGMVSSSVGAAKPGDVNYKQALDAAYYRGVKAYYDKHAIVSRIVPTGPMARIYGPVAVANSAALRAVDQKFNAGQISVVGAELGYTPAQIATAVGLNTYQTLTDYQRYGLLNSTVVTGDLTGTGLLDTDTLGQYDPSAGVIAVDTNDQDAAGVASTIQHEASHAADFAVKELVDRVMASTSSNIPQSLKDLAASIQEEVESRVAGSYYTGEIAQQYPVDYAGSIAHGTDSSPRAQRAHNYVEYAMEVTETIAYSVDPVQRQRWAEMTAMALGITQQEAAGLLNDLGYQHQQDEIDNFIDSSQGISQ